METKNLSYTSVLERKNEIMKQSLGMDFEAFEYGKIAFNYEEMMKKVGYSMGDIIQLQKETKVGQTPLFELKNLNKLIRKHAKEGKGARIFMKDEAANASGSFKARRASVAVDYAAKMGYKGVIVATSGNYGAAVASQASQRGLKTIVIQEVYDSKKIGQPEILEKARKCEAFGAEVIQQTVGPELFYTLLKLLEETKYFNASLYTPFSVAGIETLGLEVANDILELEGKYPDVVIATHAGGGNITGTARGLIKAGASKTKIVGASVDLTGLHMASDKDFNRKSFTTGHTGFGVPFATWPDRSDVPRNAARALRYMDQYVTVTQGEVFYITEALAQLEGLERGPAGNTSLAAAVAMAKTMDEDQIIVVQETEYTTAGKHPSSQLTFAKKNGITVRRGHPEDNIPGKNIVIPESFEQLSFKTIDLDKLKGSYIRNAVKANNLSSISREDFEFLVEDTNSSDTFVREVLDSLSVEINL